MAQLIADRRDVDFVLHEQLQITELRILGKRNYFEEIKNGKKKQGSKYNL